MRELQALARYFAASDELLERVRPTWWGAVVTDTRFPAVYDLNYARVDGPQPDLTLEDVERDLLPAIREAGAPHEHVVVFRPEGTGRLVEDVRRAGHELNWETPMAFAGPAPDPPGLPVEPIEELDGTFWRTQEEVYRVFDVTDRVARRQLLRWAREVLVPAGRRWFCVRDGGDIAGLGSLQVRAGVGYVDDVMTFPAHRGRGVASAVVTTLVRDALRQDVEHVLLLADEPGPIRLYEQLGFRALPRIVSSYARVDPT